MKISFSSNTAAAVAALAVITSPFYVQAALEVGKEACVEGYVMDFFCINRGTLLDRPSVVSLEGPDLHSVHCLIDVGSCVNSPYEVLIDPAVEGELYSRGFRLSENAKKQAIAVAKEVGICDDCTGVGTLRMGFRAAFDATILDLGDSQTPPTIDASNVIGSNTLSDPCAMIGKPNILDLVGNSTDFGVTGSGGNLRAKHLAHGSLMLIGWGFLLPSGVLIAKFLKHRPDGLWFRIHQPLQITGLILTLTGWIIALKNFNVFGDVGYTNYYHGIMGCTVMTIGLLQPINAFFRPHPPEAGEEKSTTRLLWEILHKSMGWIAILLAVATIILGTTILPMLDDQKTFQLAYAIGCGGGLSLLIIFICVDKANYRGDHEPVKTFDDMENRKYHS